MDLAALLRDRFGFAAFRPQQQHIIEHVLGPAGRNGTLVVMPTGGGKSLLYQIPALVLPGMTLVVSPLISLMKDQVDALQARGIRAACVNSSMSASELIAVRDQVSAGQVQLLYLAPERFKNENFMRIVEQRQVALLAIDEAHCISHWGSGFRPSYRHIPMAIQRLRPERVMALTATANAQTRQDIINNLALPQMHSIVTGFARTDLQFDRCRIEGNAYHNTKDAVLDCYDPDADMACGIVYMVTKKNCEKLVEDLRRWDIPAYVYHAGLADTEKQRVQETWMRDDGIMVATTAFGMGIDKPNVRFIINGGLPSNVEEWYQMIGRGSRDGQGCSCFLFSDAEDLRIKHFLIETQYPDVADLVRFKNWIDVESAGSSVTRDMTQADMAAAAGIHKHAASGCCAFLHRLGVIDKVQSGIWTLHHRPDISIDYAEHRRRIAEKKADIERVRQIAKAGGDIVATMSAYLAEN